jgi:hypothetical protein
MQRGTSNGTFQRNTVSDLFRKQQLRLNGSELSLQNMIPGIFCCVLFLTLLEPHRLIFSKTNQQKINHQLLEAYFTQNSNTSS